MKKVGILFHPQIPAAFSLARELAERLSGLQASAWLCSSWEEEEARGLAQGSDLVLSIGGDGTILRAARIVLPYAIPIVGINLGRLGFLTELGPEEAMERVPQLLAGEGWLDERAMLQAQLSEDRTPPLHVLNDVVVARGGRSRAIQVTVAIGGQVFTTYKCDGVILATATGSTGYSLAAGGPILHPQAREIVLQPIAPHLGLSTALVLPEDSSVELEVSAEYPALLSADGQVEVPIKSGGRVQVRRGPHLTRLLRLRPSSSFYALLMARLASRRAGPPESQGQGGESP